MNRARHTRTSEWRDGFLFLGNHLTLDFLNTRPIQNGEATELLGDFSALLRWFQAADLLSSREAANLERHWGNSSRARKTMEVMRKLRERLRTEIVSRERGKEVHAATVDDLNRLMSDYPMLTELKATDKGLDTVLYFAPRSPEDLFAPLAHSAAMLFAQGDHKRVRQCDRCALHFHDISKKGTRRWCSMQMCGNRVKVAAYAARQRLQHS